MVGPEDRRRRGRARRGVVGAERLALVGEHEDLARPVELHVLPGVRVAQLVRPLAAEDLGVDRLGRVAVAPHLVCLAERVDGVRREPVVVAGHRNRVSEPVQAALEHQHLGPALALAGLPVDDGDPLALGLEGLLPAARRVLHDQPEEPLLDELDRDRVVATTPDRDPDPLRDLPLAKNAQHDLLARHVGTYAAAHHDLLEGRRIAHALGREPLGDGDRGLAGDRSRSRRRGSGRNRSGRHGGGRSRAGGGRGRLSLGRCGDESQRQEGDREHSRSVHVAPSMHETSLFQAA